jgi:hypothetical protein
MGQHGRGRAENGGMPSAILRAVLLAAVLLSTSCAPETDLSTFGPGGATPALVTPATLVDPVAGATEVPPNLAAVTVRFPGAVTLPAAAIVVCGVSAATVGEAAQCEGGVCYQAVVPARLPAGASCRVELGEGAADGAGAAVARGLVGVFETAAGVDDQPPVIAGESLAAEGPCVAVTFTTDEAAAGTIVLRAGDAEVVWPAGAGQTSFDIAVPVGQLPPETDATVTVRAVDRAGNVAESAPIAWRTPPALPPLVITEVLANPAGAEPAQEFVELRNLGDEELSLEGLSIADARGSDALPATTLGPGGYALIVTSAFMPGSADVAPRAGTPLVRVDTRIGTDGLSNGGEVTRLLRGDQVISSYGGWVSVSSVAWAGKSVHRLVQGACDRPSAWNRSPLDATPGQDPP